MRNVLLTGATGLVGSAFISEVLRNTNDIEITALVRSRLGKSAKDRLFETMEEQFEFDDAAGKFKTFSSRLKVIDSDIATTAPEELYEKLSGSGIKTVFHCAADVNLGKDVEGKTFKNNCQGTENILAVSKKLQVEGIHFVSTAYVSGKHDGNVEEDKMVEEPSFNNAYEKSKYYSELKVRKSGIPYSIYRPSIIVGRRSDGCIRKPLAFYRILEFLAKIKKNFCAKHGLEPSMTLDIPLRFETMFSDKVYLVPMDFVQESLFKLFLKPVENQTYHITGKRPVSTQMIELAIRKFLKMPQVEVLAKVENPTKPEKLLGQFVSDLFPYFSSQMIFNVDNVCKKLGDEAVAWEYGLNELYTLTQDFYQKHFPEIVK